jgi:hypothetical protein
VLYITQTWGLEKRQFWGKIGQYCWILLENTLARQAFVDYLSRPANLGGLVAQLVEQCPFNSNRPILAIFCLFLFSLETIANTLISLVYFHF